MRTRKSHSNHTDVLFIILTLLSTAIFVITPTTGQVNAAQIGQIKVHEGFETWPPTGWTIYGILSIIQTTGFPGGECMVGHHAAKIFCSDSLFFCEMHTPVFNGKKGGGNNLTFWHKQYIKSDPDQLAVLVLNGLGDCIQVAGFSSSVNWTFETINLNDFIHPTKTMQIVFIGILHGESSIYLDEVTITGVSGE